MHAIVEKLLEKETLEVSEIKSIIDSIGVQGVKLWLSFKWW